MKPKKFHWFKKRSIYQPSVGGCLHLDSWFAICQKTWGGRKSRGRRQRRRRVEPCSVDKGTKRVGVNYFYSFRGKQHHEICNRSFTRIQRGGISILKMLLELCDIKSRVFAYYILTSGYELLLNIEKCQIIGYFIVVCHEKLVIISYQYHLKEIHIVHP